MKLYMAEYVYFTSKCNWRDKKKCKEEQRDKFEQENLEKQS